MTQHIHSGPLRTKEEVFACAMTAMKAADSKVATDCVVLDISNYLAVADYFVIATGANDKQIAAIAREVEKQLFEKHHLKLKFEEGDAKQSWLLLDFSDIVVHIFTPPARQEYRLEKLWGDAPHFRLDNEELRNDSEVKEFR